MPDLPSRKKREAEMAAALLLLFQVWEVQADEVSGLQPQDFGEMAEEVAAAVAPILVVVHGQAASQLAQEKQFAVSGKEIRRNSENWARQRATELGQQVAETTKAGFLAGKSPAELFSKSRAELIGITEVTRAITIGEGLILWQMLQEEGRMFETIWYNRPERSKTGPCPVCLPLHGRTARVWRLVAPAGPPAHPLCVCVLEYEEITNV